MMSCEAKDSSQRLFVTWLKEDVKNEVGRGAWGRR